MRSSLLVARRFLDVGPLLMPTEEDAHAGDCRLLELHIVNNSADSAEVFVSDRQDPPCHVIPLTTLPKGGMISMDSATGRLMPWGVRWGSSGPGVSGYMLLSEES